MKLVIMLVFALFCVSLIIGIILFGVYLKKCIHRDKQNEASKDGLNSILRSIHH